MDKTTQVLASYVASLEFEHLPADAVRQIKKTLIDTIGCGIGGYSSEPASIARRIAAGNTGQPPASILGSGTLTSMEMAAFANTAMVRYLDCNDTYISKGSGHPSDMIPACLAVAEARRASGRDTLVAIAAAYEVFTALADVVALRERGWDQGIYVVLGSAAGAAKLLGLRTEQIGDALAIAVSGNVATRQTRSGELSMWKGCATAAAARAGVFSALLASEGMTGPTAAFEGRHGVWDQVTGPFQLGRLGGEGVAFGIERTNLKFFPAEYHSQAPLWIALGLRNKVRVEEIEAINVQTYYTAYSEIGSEPEKWDPQTRETADHSLPYLLARALTDGRITADSFSPERIRDPIVRQLMRTISVEE
ncbi:MAG TPA: MmgE/PrpD family protein, partial [Burkholderiales bacterium]|nr:MmgE/PrpD family protein [Burkholderiales bacterium]